MKKVIKASVLTTSGKTDVRTSGGLLRITGLDPIKASDILSIERKIARTEVAQVWTIGTSAPTVVASTKYTVKIKSPGRNQGYVNTYKAYSYTAPATLSGNATTDRTLLYASLASKINADTANNVAAVATAGTSLVITDDATYYPARPNTRGGASSVLLPDGFVQATHLVLTTAAIYSYGIGTRLLLDIPVYGPVTGNLDSGEAEGVTGVVGGQKYDGYNITYKIPVNSDAVNGLTVEKYLTVLVLVDNGKGSVTTNLAGFLAFSREMDKLIYAQYSADQATILEMFEECPLFLKADGVSAPVGTAGSTTIGASNLIITKGGTLIYNLVGTGTLLSPIYGTGGLILDLDAADTEGMEITPPLEAINSRCFLVGAAPFSAKVRLKLTTITAGVITFGFREKGLTTTVDAYSADWNNYTDLAAINTTAADNASLVTSGILADAATVSTDTTIDIADATEFELEVQVAIDGTVKALVNGVSYPIYSAGTTALVLAAGTNMIPFLRSVSDGSASPITTLRQFIAAYVMPQY